jgi:hypothetical protein
MNKAVCLNAIQAVERRADVLNEGEAASGANSEKALADRVHGVRARHDNARKLNGDRGGDHGKPRADTPKKVRPAAPDTVAKKITQAPTPPTVEAPRPPELSDDALALRFAEEHAAGRRYVAFSARWLRWSGVRWEEDRTLDTFDAARGICRKAAAGCKDDKFATSVKSARTIAAVERLARSDRRLAIILERFDANPDAFGTPEHQP